MYNTTKSTQVSINDFNQAAGMQLNPENDWVIRAELIPWEELELEYAKNFPSHTGNVATPFRIAFGSLIIQKKKNISDRALVQEIAENPYLQYFLGMTKFEKEAPFTAPALVAFRKRMNHMFVNEANELLLTELLAIEDDKGKPSKNKALPINDETENVGTAILDASCAPSNIRYPTDMSLLNEAREKLEGMIDWFHLAYGFEQKPRTYRRIARKEYVAFAKTKKPGAKKVRAAVRKQLGYVKRDLGYLMSFMEQGYAPNNKHIDMLLTIMMFYKQQQYMFDNKTHRMENRIVSLSQPYIRPMVRGKARANVEFGAKFDVSIDKSGHARMEKISFDPYNESTVFLDAVEKFKNRTGYYPQRVLVDKIYRTRDNLDFCKDNGIRISGPKLGRPTNDKKKSKNAKKAEYKDNVDRIEVERFFSLAKRCSGMGLIVTKLPETTLTSIALAVFVTNLFAVPRDTIFLLYFTSDLYGEKMSYYAIFE